MKNRDEITHELTKEVFETIIVDCPENKGRFTVYQTATGTVYAERDGDSYRLIETRA